MLVDQIITSVESLEAQLDRAKEYLREGDWERLELLAGGITRTASYLASAVSNLNVQAPAAPCQASLLEAPKAYAARSSAGGR